MLTVLLTSCGTLFEIPASPYPSVKWGLSYSSCVQDPDPAFALPASPFLGCSGILRNPLSVSCHLVLFILCHPFPQQTQTRTHPSIHRRLFWPKVTSGFSLLQFHLTSRLSQAPPLWPGCPKFWTRPSCFRTGACQPDRA